MKKILCLLAMLLSLQVFARTYSKETNEESTIKISLEKGKATNDDTYPRTLIPITCVYTDGMVRLSLLGEISEFTLTVTNQLTGECWSAENALILQTSTASGIYWIQIETEDGTMYYGTYTL